MKRNVKIISVIILAALLVSAVALLCSCARLEVKFDSNGGSSVNTVQVKKGKTVNKPADPVRDGYTFGGWYKEKSCENEWNFEKFTVTENIILYAKWTKKADGVNTFWVRFESNGGSAVSEYSAVEKGSKIAEPKAPVKSGSSFVCWCKDEGLSSAWNFSSDTVTENTTLYAKWDTSVFTVYFVSNGGTSVEELKNVTYGSKISRPADPEKTGYDFVCWCKDSILNNVWNFDTDVVTSETSLYAKWEAHIVSSSELRFVSNDGDRTYVLVGINNMTAPKVVVPSSVSGIPVVAIGNGAFKNNSAIAEIELPQGIVSVGDEAFYGCVNLEKVVSESLTQIGNSAFYGCGKLAEITLPATLEDIGSSAFENCSSLKEIDIPQNVLALRSSVFAGCEELVSIKIPSGVRTIADSAFAGCAKLAEITLPSELVKIDNGAFEGCSSVKSFVIPSNVAEIGRRAFRNCFDLVSVTFSDTSESSLITSIESETFCGCSSLASVVLPKSVTNLGYAAFDGCSALENIELPEKITGIDWAAFRNCSSLDSVVIPKNAVTVGESAFYGCKGLTEIEIASSVVYINSAAFYGCENLEKVTLMQGAKQIGSEAFRNCVKLKSIAVPSGITVLGDGAFYGCASLGEVTLPAELNKLGINVFRDCTSLLTVSFPSSLSEIGNSAFENCKMLKSVIIPANVTKISDSAFKGCFELHSVVLPQNLVSVEAEAFYGCVKLASVNLDSVNVETIGSKAFYNCESLSEIELPQSVTRISLGAFEGCKNVSRFAAPFIGGNKGASGNSHFGYVFGAASYRNNGSFVPVSLKTVAVSDGTVTDGYAIADNVFYGCSNLTSVTYSKDVISMGVNAFYGCGSLLEKRGGVHYVLGWAVGCDSDVAQITLEQNVKGITSDAFFGKENITEVTLQNGVTEIPDFAFYLCGSLSNVVLPQTLSRIGAQAFFGCVSLSGLNIPANVTEIGESAFRGASASLEYINVESGNANYESVGDCLIDKSSKTLLLGCSNSVIPSDGKVTSIGREAFYGCGGLETLVIGSNVLTVGDGAFAGCSNLTEVTVSANVTSIGANAFFECAMLNSVIFENAAGWSTVIYDEESESEKTVAIENLEDKEAAAELIKNTYSGTVWTRN